MRRLLAFLLLLPFSALGQVVINGGVTISGGVTFGATSGGGGGGTTASMNLSGGHAVCDVGSAEIGNITGPCTVTITNNTGSSFTFTHITTGTSVSQTNQTVHWTQQGSARGYKENCTDLPTLTVGSSCTLRAYGVPSVLGADVGLVYLTNPSGNRLSDITINFTGTSPTNISSVTLPTGVTKNGDGTYSGFAYRPAYIGDGTCKGGVGGIISTSSGLSSALAAAQQGDTLCVLQGSVLTGNFTLRNTGDPTTSWIHIRVSDASGNLPAGFPAYGTRLWPNSTSLMAKLQTASSAAVISCATGSHNYWLTGLEIAASGSSAESLDLMLCAPTNPTSLSDFPTNIVVERNYFHPDFTNLVNYTNGIHGLEMDVVNGYVGENTVAAAYGTQEYQDVAACEAHGLSIVNNWLDGAVENVMTGGCAPLIVGNHPEDIDVRYNLITKPIQWDVYSPNYFGHPVLIKNLEEHKHGDRCFAGGNTYRNNWGAQGQDGHTWLLGAGNQSGSDITSYQRNITVANNDFQNIESGVNGVDVSYGFATQFNRNILIENNLLSLGASSISSYATTGTSFGDCFTFAAGGMIDDPVADVTVAGLPATGNWPKKLMRVTDGLTSTDCSTGGGSTTLLCRWNSPGVWSSYSGLRGNSKFAPFYNLNIKHNTCYSPNGSFAFAMTGYPGASNSTISGNALTFGLYGFAEYDNWEATSTSGDAALTNGWVSSTFGTNYLLNKSTQAGYTNFGFISTFAGVNWANIANGDFRLCTAAGAPDASCPAASPLRNACDSGTTDCGANIATINTETAKGNTDPIAAATVSSISPTHGVKAGGVTLTINGTGFSANTVVYIGGSANVNKVYMGVGGNFNGLPNRPAVSYTGSGTTATVTLNASYPLTLYPGDQIHIGYDNNASLNGWYAVASVTDTTHFTVTIPSGAPASDTGKIYFRSIDGTGATMGTAGYCTPSNTGAWTSTQIQCITPAINEGTGRPMSVHVIEKNHWTTFQSYTLD